MSVDLAGECDSCGRFTTSLFHRPDQPIEGRPSVCHDCYSTIKEEGRQE